MMRQCALPLLVTFECRLAAHLHVDMQRVRRAPLALVLLRLNYAAQADGMETWWLDETARKVAPDEVRAELEALRAGAAEVGMEW